MELIDYPLMFLFEIFLIWILYKLMLKKATREKNKFLDVLKTVATRFLFVAGLLFLIPVFVLSGAPFYLTDLHPFALAEFILALFYMQIPIVIAGYTFFKIKMKEENYP